MAAIAMNTTASGSGKKFPILLDKLAPGLVNENKTDTGDSMDAWAVAFPSEENGSAIRYVFPKEVNWAPDGGYTPASFAEHMESNDKLDKAIRKLTDDCTNEIGDVTQQMNNKKNEGAAGLQEVCQRLPEFAAMMVKGYKEIGFEGRETKAAMFQMGINLMKDKFQKRVEEVMSQDVAGDEVYRKLFLVEPWDTDLKSIADCRMTVDCDCRSAKMISWMSKVATGEIGNPTLRIHYEALALEEPREALEALVDKLSTCKCRKFFEIQFLWEKDTTDSSSVVCDRVTPFFEVMKKHKVELLRITGSSHVLADEKTGHDKVLTQMLKGMNGVTFKSELQRLDLSNALVDFDTIQALNDFMHGATVSALNLSHWKLGLRPCEPPYELKMATRDGACGDGCKLCCYLHNMDCGVCLPACCTLMCCACCCAPKLADHVSTKAKFDAGLAKFHSDNAALTGEHNGAALFKGVFDKLTESARTVDTLDLSNTFLPAFCGTTDGVNELLAAIAKCKATAINLEDTGLTDAHVWGMTRLFCHNPNMLHLSISIIPGFKKNYPMTVMQEFVANSPYLVSGGLFVSKPFTVEVAQPVQFSEPSKQGYCCCLGLGEMTMECGPCCYSVQEVTVSQSSENLKFQVPAKIMDPKDSDIYCTAIREEIEEHRIMPLLHILKGLYKGDQDAEKMKKLLKNAAQEEFVRILGVKVDDKKKALFDEFFDGVQSQAETDKMFELEMQEEMGGIAPEQLAIEIGIAPAVQE